MDVQTGLVYVAVVVISALVIGFVSIFAMKEKSYEEAIAEQRKLPDDLLLAGKKEKGKERKHKNKTGKKVKEKKEEKDDKDDKPEHVQFEEIPQILTAELPPPPSQQESNKGTKKRGKIDKVKPILVNKDEPVVVVTEPSLSQHLLTQEVNHFEVIQPKDDLELIRSHSRENLHQIGQLESGLNKSPKETPTKSKKNAKEKDSKRKEEQKEEKKEASPSLNQQVTKENVKEIKEKPKESVKEPKESKEPKEVIKENVVSLQSSNKESKKIKKKNDILAQIGGDRDGVNFSLLKPLVQKAELSRSEIQFLIDQLLNKQQDNPLEHAEWTESRADPVIKLKKQLAEREKALKDEQEASASVQSKLLELRAELNGERARLSGSVRQLEEALQAKAADAQTLHTRMQHILESHAAEKQGFSRQIEQLQTKLAEDAAVILKMQEEQGQSHGQMQQELLAQRKQLDAQFAQMRENENALKAQVAQKCLEYQELQNVNINMQQELQATCESSTQEIEMLRQQVTMMQDQIMRSESQLQHYKEASDRLVDMHHQLEEARRAQSEAEHRAKSVHRHEQELQKQASWLQSELDAAKAGAAQVDSLNEQLDKLRAELAALKSGAPGDGVATDNSEAAAALLAQLKAREQELVAALSELHKCQEELRELQKILAQTRAEFSKIHSPVKEAKSADAEVKIIKLQEENERLSSRASNMVELQKEIKHLREKNELLASELAASIGRPMAEGRENGIEEKTQKNSIQALESTNLLAQKEDQLVALRTTLTQKENELDQLSVQVESLRSEVNNQRSITSRLQDDLEYQRSRNNDDVQKRKIEEEATKALLQRIFPEIEVAEKSHDQWLKLFEEQVIAHNKLKADSNSDDVGTELEKTNNNLQAMVAHYKQIIYDTEGMLNKLQSHIESEEKRWQAQLEQKESEVSNLRVEINDLQTQTTSNNEMQRKIVELESRLSEAETVKETANFEAQTVQSSHGESRVQDFSVLEQLQEEKTRLTEQLQNESSKLAKSEAEVAKLHLVVETSESSLAQEKILVSQMQQEMLQLKNEVCGGSSNSDQSTLNGPPLANSPKSEPTLGAQCLIAALEKTLLKNTELENCSSTEPDDSVESRQDIDDDSLTSKLASNTCQSTVNVFENSCSPLNGQQNKKHKKKRKGGSGKK